MEKFFFDDVIVALKGIFLDSSHPLGKFFFYIITGLEVNDMAESTVSRSCDGAVTAFNKVSDTYRHTKTKCARFMLAHI